MSNPYKPMAVNTLFSDVYKFVENVTEQSDFNHYFEAMAEMSERRKAGRTERQGQEIAFTNMLRCLDSANANPNARRWLEALRPDGYVDFMERF